MRKIDTPELTICFPVRIDSDHRMRNLLSALSYYQRVTNARIIVIEADAEPHVADIMAKRYPSVLYRFVYDTNEIFHRTHYINEMFRMTRSKIAAVADCDILVPGVQILAAYKALMSSDTDVMAIPYDGVVWSVNQYYSDLFHHKGDIRLLSEVTAPRSALFSFGSVGGFFIVDVERYRLFGWENEHFIGWGPEDAERHHRLTILGHPPVIIPGEIYHLYHSRGINSGYAVEEVTLATKSEYCKVCSMWPHELRAYVDSWQWTK